MFLDLSLFFVSSVVAGFFSACRFCYLEEPNARFVYTRSFSELGYISISFTLTVFLLIMSEHFSFIHMTFVLASVFVTTLS